MALGNAGCEQSDQNCSINNSDPQAHSANSMIEVAKICSGNKNLIIKCLKDSQDYTSDLEQRTFPCSNVNANADYLGNSDLLFCYATEHPEKVNITCNKD